MDWPTNEDCYHAMEQLASYYMNDEQKIKWLSIIDDGLKTGIFPPGKGFLYELDQVIKSCDKPRILQHSDLYQLICTVCI
jgi:hypothetical protein